MQESKKLEKVKLVRIVPDATFQVRICQGGTFPEKVLEYKEAIEGGAVFPPIDVWERGESYVILDGFHRISALQKIYPKLDVEISCMVHQCDEDTAWKFAMCANWNHGLRRTGQELVCALRRWLAKFPHESGEKIAAQMHCSVSYACRIKAEYSKVKTNSTSGTAQGLNAKTSKKVAPTSNGPPSRKQGPPQRKTEPEKPPIVCNTGFPVPQGLPMIIWETRGEAKAAIHAANDLLRFLRKMHEEARNRMRADFQALLLNTQDVKQSLLSHALPYAVCPTCGGVPDAMSKCQGCHKSGILTKAEWHFVPPELKAARKEKYGKPTDYDETVE